MRYGILLSFQAPAEFGVSPTQVFEESLLQAELADEIGFDSVWVTEHHFADDGYLSSPLIASAAIAARTSRVRVGQAITILPLANPIRFAEDIATIDVMSGGRIDVGVGMGYRREEYDGIGIDWDSRVQRFEESLDIIRRAWTDDVVDVAGTTLKVRRARVMPRPIQRPHPPIWLGAKKRPAMERAARMGAPFILPMTPSIGEVADQAAMYRSVLLDEGKNPTETPMALLREVWVDASREQALARTEQSLRYTYSTIYRPEKIPYLDGDRVVSTSSDPYLASTAFRDDRMLHGDGTWVRDRLAEYVERVGMDLLIGRFALPGMPHDNVVEAMKRFSDDVMDM